MVRPLSCHHASLLLAGALGVLTGCTAPSTYATARTLDPGTFTNTIALEAVGYHSPVNGAGVLPVFPTYAMRVGVIDRVDVGARIGSLTEIGADLKVNFLRGRLDLAAAAGAEAFIEWNYDPPETRRSGAIAYFHFPIIASLNVSKRFSLVGTPGISYIIGKHLSEDFARTQVFGGETLAARLGVGIDYRYAERRAFHPEITVLQAVKYSSTVVLFGLGFNFGTMPKYDDIKDDDEHEHTPQPPPAPAQPQPPAQPTPAQPTPTPTPAQPTPTPTPTPTPPAEPAPTKQPGEEIL